MTDEEKIAELQDKFAKEEVQGEAGAGFVKITMNCNYIISKIEHEDNPYILKDLRMFEDILVCAFNSAIIKVEEKRKQITMEVMIYE
jgi:hypothetical protein